nr:hypothetical protein [Mixta mediterraneensis]
MTQHVYYSRLVTSRISDFNLFHPYLIFYLLPRAAVYQFNHAMTGLFCSEGKNLRAIAAGHAGFTFV